MILWRICKVRHPPYDGRGARLAGARWNSPGRAIIYASDSFAGAILEILAHSLRPRTLPGPHHAVRLIIPDSLVETPDSRDLGSWSAPGSAHAREVGDHWFDSRRSVALSLPSLPARPVGRTVAINPTHPRAGGITVGDPFLVPWDDRLF